MTVISFNLCHCISFVLTIDKLHAVTHSGANIAFASRVAVIGSPCRTRDMDHSCRDVVLCRATPLQQSPIKRKVKSVMSAFKFVSTYYKLVPPTTEREPLIDKLTSDLRSSTLGHLHHVVRRTSSYDFAAGCVLMCTLDSFKTHLLMSVKVVDSLSINCMVLSLRNRFSHKVEYF